MADTGVKYPATVSTVQETGDDNDWTTPAEVVSDNGVYGNITAASFDAVPIPIKPRAVMMSVESIGCPCNTLTPNRTAALSTPINVVRQLVMDSSSRLRF